VDAEVLIGAQLCPARKFSAWRVEASWGGLIEPDDSLIALVIVAPT
jgi:hypothetical protein